MATGVIANSEATKLDCIAMFKVKVDKIMVIPNAVGDYYGLFNPSIKSNSKIVYAGRLHQSKGVDVLIKAFNSLSSKYSELTLDIYGSGPMHKELTESVNVDAQIKVRFKGFAPKNVILKAFAESVCVVVPSYTEAFGLTVIEAMSMKTCIIGANNTGIKEIIQPGITGLLFKTGDAEDLAENIELILADEISRNKLAIEGYDHFKKNYEVVHNIGLVYKHFKTLLC